MQKVIIDTNVLVSSLIQKSYLSSLRLRSVNYGRPSVAETTIQSDLKPKIEVHSENTANSVNSGSDN